MSIYSNIENNLDRLSLTDDLCLNLNNYQNLLLINGNDNEEDMLTPILERHIRTGNTPMLVTDPNGQIFETCFGQDQEMGRICSERNYQVINTTTQMVNFLPWCANSDGSPNVLAISAAAASLSHVLSKTLNSTQQKAAYSYLSFIIGYTCTLGTMRCSLNVLHDVAKLGTQITSFHDEHTRLDWLYKIQCMDQPDSFLARSYNVYNSAQADTRKFVAQLVEALLSSFLKRTEVELSLDDFIATKRVIFLYTDVEHHKVGQTTTLLNTLLARFIGCSQKIEFIADASCIEMPPVMLENIAKNTGNISFILTGKSLSDINYICPPETANFATLMHGIFFAKATENDLKQLQFCTQYQTFVNADRAVAKPIPFLKKKDPIFKFGAHSALPLFCGEINAPANMSDTYKVHIA